VRAPATLVLADGAVEAVVDPGLGGRLASLRVDGVEVLVLAGPSPLEQGWYPMAPFAGRLRDGRFHAGGEEHQVALTAWPNAIHGTVHSVPWEVTEAGPTACTLVTSLGAGWPFAGAVRHRIGLDGRSVRVTLEVTSDGAAFPASAGWHPWFRRRLDTGDPVEIGLHAGAMWELGDDGLPTGRLVEPTPGPWDDCFTDLRAPTTLRWRGALGLEVTTSCPHVVVFDERPEGVCVEPQTGPPDALHLRPVEVRPDRPLLAEATFTFTACSDGRRDGPRPT
jgi:galactose mutarotase-like enzyme